MTARSPSSPSTDPTRATPWTACHADALEAAFAAFEADDTASVAVLTGAGGTFCAGADLQAIATGTGNRWPRTDPGPWGPPGWP